MSIKDEITNIVFRELSDLMASENFARFSNQVWQQVNRLQNAVGSTPADRAEIAGRLQRLEQKAAAIETKLKGLEELMIIPAAIQPLNGHIFP